MISSPFSSTNLTWLWQKYGARISLKRFHTHSKEFRRYLIVCRDPLEILARGALHREIEVSRGAQICRVTKVPYPSVARSELSADFGCAITRIIIVDD